jgi:hypothetical protein
MDIRPKWIAVAIITCVIFGSTIQKCLTCGKPAHAAPPGKTVEVEDGSPIVAKSIEAMPKPAAAPAPPEERPAGLEDHEDVSFDKLASYAYEVSDLKRGETPKDQIPVSVKELDGRKVAIQGFMLPYKNTDDGVAEFILLRNQGLCCMGTVPRFNEWVHVTMAEGTSAPYKMDVPITVFGTLSIGEVYEWQTGRDGVERGIPMSVNRMAGTVVVVPPVYR